jgi:hypothetical protein
MPDYPCITVLGPIRAAGEPDRGAFALPVAEETLRKGRYGRLLSRMIRNSAIKTACSASLVRRGDTPRLSRITRAGVGL